jgi:hypothetical protein
MSVARAPADGQSLESARENALSEAVVTSRLQSRDDSDASWSESRLIPYRSRPMDRADRRNPQCSSRGANRPARRAPGRAATTDADRS